MNDEKAKGILVAAMIWIVIIGVLSVAAKYFILPYFKKDLVDKTGSKSAFKHDIRLAADSFSGYAVLRSPIMKKTLKDAGIKLTVKDDNADYDARMHALEKKDVEMAVFTIDSFIQAGNKLGNYPATIVMVIDESRGADAIVAYNNAVANVEDLNHSDTGIVLTPHSPSEFLARTIVAHFNLPLLPESWMIPADGSKAVFQKFEKADKAKKQAFVLWEPYVSRALKTGEAHVLIDSSKLSGYIVDVLVVERSFLKDHPDQVKTVVEAYLKALFAYNHSREEMAKLLIEDAVETGGDALDQDTAAKMADRIQWKNTLENYACFGLDKDKDVSGILSLEDMIGNIRLVLGKTGFIPGNALEGKEHTLYYDKVLSDLKAEDFNPGKKDNVIKGLGPGTVDLDKVRSAPLLNTISDSQWVSLHPVGSLRVDPISFARGAARINIQSDRDLKELAHRLSSFPQYYLKVVGHARAEGDRQANRKLAADRADAAMERLIASGMDPKRLKVEVAPASQSEGADQSVSFIVGEAAF